MERDAERGVDWAHLSLLTARGTGLTSPRQPECRDSRVGEEPSHDGEQRTQAMTPGRGGSRGHQSHVP
jgi:hypothetical protein